MMFRIPPEIQPHFLPRFSDDDELSPEALQWLDSMGFDPEYGTFPDFDVTGEDFGWEK